MVFLPFGFFLDRRMGRPPFWPGPSGRLLAAVAAFALAGCASMSPEECRVADWAEQGYKDGRSGLTPTRITEHRKACAEVGVVPDAQRYRQGWDRGVQEYCTPTNGLAQGRACGFRDIRAMDAMGMLCLLVVPT